MAQHSALPVTNIGQPGAFAVPNVTRQIVSDLQLISPKYYKQFVEKFGTNDYFTWLSTFAGMELAEGFQFFHFEDYGKLLLAVATTGAVTQGSSGANVVLTLSSDSHYLLNGTSYSPARVGEGIRLASSGMEGKIISKSIATPGAHTITVRPNSTATFASAGGSGTIVSGEVLVLLANVDAGEASSDIDTQTDIDVRVNGSVTEIRDDWKATDKSEMETVYYDYQGDAPVSTGSIKSAYTLKGLVKFGRRYLAITNEKLMKGDLITNTGLSTGSLGTQGMLPAVAARGGKTTYTQGSMTIANIHTAMRYQLVQGSPKQIHWLQDTYQHTDFSDMLTSAYTGGSFVYGSNGSSTEEASLAYGFKNFSIDGFFLQATNYPFNTEILTGRAPALDLNRDFGLLIPQGTTLSKGKSINNVTVMYAEPPEVSGSSADGSVGNGIRTWRYGGGSPNATDGTMIDKVSMLSYKGVRCAAINQFQTLVGQ